MSHPIDAPSRLTCRVCHRPLLVQRLSGGTLPYVVMCSPIAHGGCGRWADVTQVTAQSQGEL